MPDDHPAADTDVTRIPAQQFVALVASNEPEPAPGLRRAVLQARLVSHRSLHLHDAAVDDLRELWALEHPDGAEPWD